MLEQTEGVIVDSAIGIVVCPSCEKIMERGYYRFSKRCPYCGCESEPVIIDEFLAPTIILLNKKGYKTRTCCSGHICSSNGYIEFESHDLLDSVIEFSKGKYNFYRFDGYDEFVIRWKITDYNTSIIKSMDDLIGVSKLLYRWAKNLPDLKKDVLK